MLYKRASALIAYWDDGVLTVKNYARGTSMPLTPEVASVLEVLRIWHPAGDIGPLCPQIAPDALAALLASLVDAGMIECTQQPLSATEQALRSWDAWSPAATFFHFDTKDVAYVDRAASAASVERRMLFDPPLPRTERTPSIELPEAPRRGAFPSVLLSRRSWRRFAATPIALHDLSTLLGLTWGTQQWMHVRDDLAVPLKTSPSGGACHSLEVYVVARSVEGLAPGLYQYTSDTHGLAQIGPAWSDDAVAHSLGGQHWTAQAGAVLFMTAVFPRVQWKYNFARAYRVVLLEAGHFCQTFCLIATWLKLAPFCTAALADSTIEQALGVDGATESVLYAMGVGTRPEGAPWTPWPDRNDPITLTAPASRRRRPSKRRSRQGSDRDE